MKLVIERTPGGSDYLLRADTHDGHVRPKPGSPDEAAFNQLIVENQRLAEAIELAWERDGLPTFKSHLRQDLARRLAAARTDRS